jgi:hypothetical protein
LVGLFILPSLPSKAKFFHQLAANNHLTKDSD